MVCSILARHHKVFIRAWWGLAATLLFITPAKLADGPYAELVLLPLCVALFWVLGRAARYMASEALWVPGWLLPAWYRRLLAWCCDLFIVVFALGYVTALATCLWVPNTSAALAPSLGAAMGLYLGMRRSPQQG